MRHAYAGGFVSTTNLTKDTNYFVGIHERWRSTNEDECGNAMRHVHAGGFASLAERLRSLAC